ncbi:hypothetical protein A2154_00330 [Candidatus Gottesmanbacteria bacterium RBG_16_43_7]|uniref:Diaminopimelate epimerase n=1 Tax=Candidatus Gottesmanbacteria bacterium RBG_16_43_7 TaxID=1798373 RepID=A0A1F5Z897_9BACT|nr:MAG: hypothetical protein A2154_00330 [Candidatus Gottesmanbacteria bacterium RBG_16_43_7]
MKKTNYLINIYNPGGNITALVSPIVFEPNIKKKINDLIMKKYLNVEQVGFVNNLKSKNVLEMAGGEFCGNATRCSAYYYLQGLPGKINITVSGSNDVLSTGINNNGYVWVQIPISQIKVYKMEFGTIVEFPGITILVIDRNNYQYTSPNQAKNIAYLLLKNRNLLLTKKAAGVMFVDKTSNLIKIDPIVWVRDIKTLFFETGCASGSMAVGIVKSLKMRSSINLPILQPVNKLLYADIEYQNNMILSAKITGQLKLINCIKANF